MNVMICCARTFNPKIMEKHASVKYRYQVSFRIVVTTITECVFNKIHMTDLLFVGRNKKKGGKASSLNHRYPMHRYCNTYIHIIKEEMPKSNIYLQGQVCSQRKGKDFVDKFG